MSPPSTQAIILDDRAKALAHYPHARRVGQLLFVSGISCRRPDNTHAGVTYLPDGTVQKDIALQTEAVIDNIRLVLQAAGADLSHLVDMTTFLVDMADFKAYNEVYNRYFDKETGPTRTTVAVRELPHPNLLIEMKAIACL
ncbi:MAG: RidA family protein [Myxococcota bacterium]